MVAPWASALLSPFGSVAVFFVLQEPVRLQLFQVTGVSGCGETGERQGRHAGLADGQEQDPSDNSDRRPGTRADTASRTPQLQSVAVRWSPHQTKANVCHEESQ